jgi:hypothetical protein
MTTMFPSYSGIPIDVIDEGHWAEMSGGAKGLYIVLCRMSDRYSSRQVTIDDGEICKKAGIVPRTLFSARKELVTKGLITYSRHVYEVCDATTQKPYSKDPKAKLPYKSKSPPVVPTETELTLRDEGVDLSDVDFPYGWNLIVQPTEQPPPPLTPPTYDFSFS